MRYALKICSFSCFKRFRPYFALACMLFLCYTFFLLFYRRLIGWLYYNKLQEIKKLSEFDNGTDMETWRTECRILQSVDFYKFSTHETPRALWKQSLVIIFCTSTQNYNPQLASCCTRISLSLLSRSCRITFYSLWKLLVRWWNATIKGLTRIIWICQDYSSK